MVMYRKLVIGRNMSTEKVAHSITLNLKQTNLLGQIYPKSYLGNLLVGIDLATRTGWSSFYFPKTTPHVVVLNCGVIEAPRKKDAISKVLIASGKLRVLVKYLIDTYNPKQTIVTFENCHLGKWKSTSGKSYWKWGVTTFRFLSRLSGGVIVALDNLQVDHVTCLYATEARSLIGIKGNLPKTKIVRAVNKLLNTKLLVSSEHDIADAIVLALSGGKKYVSSKGNSKRNQ